MENHGVVSLGINISSALKLIEKYHEKFKSIEGSPASNCRAKK